MTDDQTVAKINLGKKQFIWLIFPNNIPSLSELRIFPLFHNVRVLTLYCRVDIKFNQNNSWLLPKIGIAIELVTIYCQVRFYYNSKSS